MCKRFVEKERKRLGRELATAPQISDSTLVHMRSDYKYEDSKNNVVLNTGKWVTDVAYQASITSVHSKANRTADILTKIGLDNCMLALARRSTIDGVAIKDRKRVRVDEKKTDLNRYWSKSIS